MLSLPIRAVLCLVGLLGLASVKAQTDLAKVAYPLPKTAPLGHIALAQMDALSANHLSTWSDPQTGSEIAILGLNNGIAFIDITHPNQPAYMGKLPTHSGNSLWRESVVYKNYLFVVSRAEHHGLQVFSLDALRKFSGMPLLYEETHHVSDFGSAIHLSVNEQSQRLYVTGVSADAPFEYSTWCYSLDTPSQPKFLEELRFGGRVRSLVTTTTGAEGTKKEVLLAVGEQSIQVYDGSKLESLPLLSEIPYQATSAANAVFVNTKLEELIVIASRDTQDPLSEVEIKVYDFSNEEKPVLKHRIPNGTGIYRSGNLQGTTLYLACATGGIGTVELSEEFQTLVSMRYHTTHTRAVTPLLGAWDVEVLDSANTVLVCDVSTGLLILPFVPTASSATAAKAIGASSFKF